MIQTDVREVFFQGQEWIGREEEKLGGKGALYSTEDEKPVASK